MSKRPTASGLGFIPPMLPTLFDHPPRAGDWIHEIKFDGYRTQIVIDNGAVKVFTRNGVDWTQKYRHVAEEAAEIGVDQAIIDGELVVPDEQGKPRFGHMRTAIAERPHDLIFVAFDILFLNGHDVRGLSVEERRHLLADLIEPGGRIQFSEALEGEAADIFRSIEAAGLEGMVSKRKGSRYVSGRTTDWLKIKSYEVADFDIIGVQRERGKPAMVLMADKGRYIGGAFVTLPSGIRQRLWDRVEARAGGKPPKGLAVDKAEWLKPGLRGRAKFLRGEEMLRHASLQSFKEID